MASRAPRLTRQELYSVAYYQKIILWCLLAYVIAVIAQFTVPSEVRLVMGITFIGVGILAAVFVFMMALKVYGTTMGIVLGIMTLIPLVGLIALLVINQKATKLLTQRGYRVGLMGADLAEFRDED